eukprot:Nitzschia sp. Nitz4//scaffold64_size103689//19678//21438//NITZ4_004424-RA/size103689-processed-gene-0.97-mRNA-1//-1//CDS//3329556094//8821//frame0
MRILQGANVCWYSGKAVILAIASVIVLHSCETSAATASTLFDAAGTEYDHIVLDPDTPYGSPYGGFSRATSSRLARLPLELDSTGQDLKTYQPTFFQIHDFAGRPYSCRTYHEDELEQESLETSMFDLAVLKGESPSRPLPPAEKALPQAQRKQIDAPESPGDETAPTEGGDSIDQSGMEKPIPTNTEQIVHTLVEKLQGMCAQYHHGWWSYEWCYKDKIEQFHVEIQSKDGERPHLEVVDLTNLGEFNERRIYTADEDSLPETTEETRRKVHRNMKETNDAIAEVHDMFTNGDTCPGTGRPRETEAILKCCTPKLIDQLKGTVLKEGDPIKTSLLAFHHAVESDVCTYSLTLCTPLLCKAEVTAKEKKNTTEDLSPQLSASQVEDMSIQEIIEASFVRGRNECIEFGSGGWWVYEFCPGKHVRQFHETAMIDRSTGVMSARIDTEHFLGRYDGDDHPRIPRQQDYNHVVNATDPTENVASNSRRLRALMPHSGNGAYFAEEYRGGDTCDHVDVTDSAIKAGAIGEGLVERATVVQYGCGNKLELSVTEDSTCHYVAHVSVPALCLHPLFKAPLVKKQVVKCLPNW